MELLFPLVFLGLMYWFLIRPQRRQAQERDRMMSSIDAGDDIVTSGGIYGAVTERVGDDLFVEIAPQIEIRMSVRGVAEKLNNVDDSDDGESEDEDDAAGAEEDDNS
ncbi:MAG: preprotein translocase subunit YajC [Actinomycetota bacterium]|nr:preprotein translocase subunit YajC [Actinomycetota bacterium]